jgi:predicted GIY-YIG superfamily endonuclease
MTYNERQGVHQFSQGQVAVVVELPDDTAAFENQRLRLRLAPPGIREIDVSNIPDAWPTVVVGPRKTPASVVGKYLQMGQRIQFPVRYYFCSTIHRIQGETVPLLATQLSDTDRQYRLWQKEQFVVLISRVHRCKDVIFVGSQSETRRAVVRILGGSSKWDTLVDHYLSVLDVAVRPAAVRQILMDSHPFLPIYRELPSSSCGYVYMIASTSKPGKFFIGETDDLKRCLRNHNTGYGSVETMDTSCHPWGVFAFIVGFESDRADACTVRREFVDEWYADRSGGLEAAYQFGVRLADEWMLRGFKLTVVKCGQVSVQSALT